VANNDIARLSNLGHGVSTRLISWEQQVRDAEGSRWNLPIGKYFFGDANQYVFVEYDDAIQGPPGTPAPVGSPAPILTSVTGYYTIFTPSGNGASGPQSPVQYPYATLVWEAPTDSPIVPYGYYLSKSTSATGPFYGFSVVLADTLTINDFVVTPGDSYFYELQAFDINSDLGPVSNILGCTIPTTATPGPAPAGYY